MATVVHDDFRDAQLGNPTHSVIDFKDETIDSALIPSSSATITSTFIDFDEVDAVVGASGSHASKTVGTVATGVYDAADLTFSAVSSTEAVQDYLTVHKQASTVAVSPLAITYDSATTGIPLTPNGGDVTVQWATTGILQI